MCYCSFLKHFVAWSNDITDMFYKNESYGSDFQFWIMLSKKWQIFMFCIVFPIEQMIKTRKLDVLDWWRFDQKAAFWQ